MGYSELASHFGKWKCAQELTGTGHRGYGVELGLRSGLGLGRYRSVLNTRIIPSARGLLVEPLVRGCILVLCDTNLLVRFLQS